MYQSENFLKVMTTEIIQNIPARGKLSDWRSAFEYRVLLNLPIPLLLSWFVCLEAFNSWISPLPVRFDVIFSLWNKGYL